MPPQVSKEMFSKALKELGHAPESYQNQRITLEGMAELYDMNQDSILEAIETKEIAAHYDYRNDVIWIDALEAAHFYFCVQSATA